MRRTFELSYTRDTTIIMQQLWLEAQEHRLHDHLMLSVPHTFIGIDYMNHGAIEIWEDRAALTSIKAQLVALSFKDPEQVITLLTQHEQELHDLEIIWNKEVLATHEELCTFIQKIGRLVLGDLILTYLGTDERTQPQVRKQAARLRTQDHFFASNDTVIRRSLECLFPRIGSYVTCITLEELFENRIPSLSLCKKRFTHFVLIGNGYRAVETLHDFNKKSPNCYFLKEKIETRRVLQGQIAYRGIMHGKARILRLQQEISEVREGEIIISPMTTPALMPALQKAAAIVTDEGGMLSHAAVTAREMKKPCIIGTKIATKVFKTGDMIEVDANTGVVRKL